MGLRGFESHSFRHNTLLANGDSLRSTIGAMSTSTRLMEWC